MFRKKFSKKFREDREFFLRIIYFRNDLSEKPEKNDPAKILPGPVKPCNENTQPGFRTHPPIFIKKDDQEHHLPRPHQYPIRALYGLRSLGTGSGKARKTPGSGLR
jgi:hypothetical protein